MLCRGRTLFDLSVSPARADGANGPKVRRAQMDTGDRALVSVAIEKLDEHAVAIRAFDCEGGLVSDQDCSSPR